MYKTHTPDGKPIGYPGVTDIGLIAALNAVLAGAPAVDQRSAHVTDYTLFHNVAYADGGHTQLRFFNVAGQEGGNNWTTNMPAANQLPIDHIFVCRGVSVVPYFSLTTAGAQVAAGATLSAGVADGAALAALFVDREAQINALRGGYLEVKIGDRIIAHGPDLTRWPAGRGVKIDAALTGVSTTTMHFALNINNGNPCKDSLNRFAVPYVIWPNKTIQATLSWQAAIDTDIACMFGVELFGQMIRKPT